MRARLKQSLLAGSITLVVALSSLLPAAAYHDNPFMQHPFANHAFGARHNRTDQPVIDGQKRTWVWGPSPLTEGMLEPYVDAPGGMRLVQYLDKARMEINNPSGNPNDLWYVTTGHLVIDMVEGRYQTGHATFDNSPTPAAIAIAGDPDDTSEVTYAAINALGLRGKPALAAGTVIKQTIKGGAVVQDEKYATYNAKAGHRVQVNGIDHTVAAVFWDFMNSSGIIYENHQAKVDKLFLNAFYATGYPITEAYWATVNVGGFPKDVLWQCFERRCLTFTPDNAAGWKVEAGNVGQHYFRWRYGAQGPAQETVNLAYIAIGDGGKLGPKIGCDDSLVMAQAQIQQLASTEHKVQAALQRLFVTHHAEWSNTFIGQDIIVQSVSVNGGIAEIRIVGNLVRGGVCDDPRIEEQIRATATQFGGVNDVTIFVNGQAWSTQQ